MDLFINGAGLICAAGSNVSTTFPGEDLDWEADRLNAKEPDYSSWIPLMQLRRMSKAVRMGIGASKICLANSGVAAPDALSVGTALGCLADTEQFLTRMIEREEQQLTPTSFIQSTHNTVAGQIALVLGCNGHNLSFVHKGHSFEHALINAGLYLNDHPEHVVLTGGLDELTDNSVFLMQKAGIFSEKIINSADFITNTRKGSIAGEGAGFFSVTKKATSNNYLNLKELRLFVAKRTEDAMEQITHFISSLPVSETAIDLVLTGENGDEQWANVYRAIKEHKFSNALFQTFKQFTGEYATASAVGLGLVSQTAFAPGRKKIVFINNYLDHFSCWYLERNING